MLRAYAYVRHALARIMRNARHAYARKGGGVPAREPDTHFLVLSCIRPNFDLPFLGGWCGGELSDKSIQDWLLSEAAAGRFPVLREVQARFGVAPMTASRARRALIQSGLLPEVPRSRKPAGPLTRSEERLDSLSETVADPSAPGTVEQEIAAATGGGMLSTDEQRERLSWLADHAQREEVRISALSTLARLDAMAGASRRQNRGLVLSEDELLDRTALLLRGLGRSRCDRALALAFPS